MLASKKPVNTVFMGFLMAEKVGFEPTCRLPDKRISSAPRYDLFDTSPYKLRRMCQ